MGSVEERNFKHGDDSHIRDRLASEKAQFKNTREVGDVQHSHSGGKEVVGEHIHHHVHENIQPVIQKETIQPSVVHTTIPVHEVHQNESKHHTASALPAMSMDDFKRQGGHLSGREERRDDFQGEPKSVGGTLGGHGASGNTSLTESEGHNGHHSSTQNPLNNNTTNGHHNDGITNSDSAPYGSAGHHSNGVGHDSTTTHKKPSLMDKLNPKIDSNGDGKAGFMK